MKNINYTTKKRSLPLLCLFIFLLTLTMLWKSKNTLYYAHSSVTLCLETLIPSLFPFLVANTLLLSCGFEKICGRILRRPFEALFHINSNLACALAVGTLCGYPQGAYTVYGVYKKGGCSKEEAEQALCFCNNTGPSFLLGCVGTMTGSIKRAVLLYIVQLAVSFLYAVITRPKRLIKHPDTKDEYEDITLSVFPRAISASLYPMACICGFVIFFGIIAGFIRQLPLPIPVCGLLLSFTEISNACSYLCALEEPFAIALTAFASAFSGICVHMQIFTVLQGKLSMKKYYISKLIQGSACAIIFYLIQIGT